jgi:hypothetical protein
MTDDMTKSKADSNPNNVQINFWNSPVRFVQHTQKRFGFVLLNFHTRKDKQIEGFGDRLAIAGHVVTDPPLEVHDPVTEARVVLPQAQENTKARRGRATCSARPGKIRSSQHRPFPESPLRR